jgi:hypothetical protein
VQCSSRGGTTVPFIGKRKRKSLMRGTEPNRNPSPRWTLPQRPWHARNAYLLPSCSPISDAHASARLLCILPLLAVLVVEVIVFFHSSTWCLCGERIETFDEMLKAVRPCCSNSSRLWLRARPDMPPLPFLGFLRRGLIRLHASV